MNVNQSSNDLTQELLAFTHKYLQKFIIKFFFTISYTPDINLFSFNFLVSRMKTVPRFESCPFLQREAQVLVRTNSNSSSPWPAQGDGGGGGHTLGQICRRCHISILALRLMERPQCVRRASMGSPGTVMAD